MTEKSTIKWILTGNILLLSALVYFIIGAFIYKRLIMSSAAETPSIQKTEESPESQPQDITPGPDVTLNSILQEAIELSRSYAREQGIIPSEQGLADRLKGDVNIIGWRAAPAFNVGNIFDGGMNSENGRLFINSLQVLTQELPNLKNLNYDWYPNSGLPQIENILMSDDPDFIKIRRVYNLIKQAGNAILMRIPQVQDEEKEEITSRVRKNLGVLTGLLNNSFYFDDGLYFVSFTYKDEEDLRSGNTHGFFFEVDLDSRVVRRIAGDTSLEKKYNLGQMGIRRGVKETEEIEGEETEE